ncbi:PAIR1 protein [Nymphaea thermarum]|nr:PAIR1 protein [Nymphaea thermarum]
MLASLAPFPLITVGNFQRLGSQDRENSVKRAPCLAPGYGLEEGQLQLRSSTNMLRRWNPPTASDNRCITLSEELERRLGMIDTTLHRLGMILDSVQGDVMQINKAVKELKEEEAIKASIDGTMKSIPDELRKEANQPKLQEIVSKLTSMPDFIETRFYKLKAELCCAFTQEIQAIKEKKEMSCSKEPPLLNDRSLLPAKNVAYTNASGSRKQHLLQQGSGELHGSLTKTVARSLNSSRVETWKKKVKEEEQPSTPGWEIGQFSQAPLGAGLHFPVHLWKMLSSCLSGYFLDANLARRGTERAAGSSVLSKSSPHESVKACKGHVDLGKAEITWLDPFNPVGHLQEYLGPSKTPHFIHHVPVLRPRIQIRRHDDHVKAKLTSLILRLVTQEKGKWNIIIDSDDDLETEFPSIFREDGNEYTDN